MKHIIILGDGMSDHPVESLGGRTPLQAASTPHLDKIARLGVTGRLITVPEGFPPGSEVANTAILGYDLNEVYEGRGPLEAASIGYEMAPDDMAIRCNLISLAYDGEILNHHGGHLSTEDGSELIKFLDSRLGSERVRFIPGIQYRHLLIIKGGNKHIICNPPHDHPGENADDLMPAAATDPGSGDGRLSPEQTSEMLCDLIMRSRELLASHPINQKRIAEGKLPANSIWPWSPGYRPRMKKLHDIYPSLGRGAVISAVDLIKGIGHYAGLEVIEVEGATGLADTNYEGKAQAAIDALRRCDFVFLHLEATDEAGHDGNIDLKIKAIEYLDSRVVRPILEETASWDEPVRIALLPDHATPVESRIHVAEPVPLAIYTPGAEPDGTMTYDEESASHGSLGTLRLHEFMDYFMS